MLTECKTGRNTHQTLHVFRVWLGIDCLQIAVAPCAQFCHYGVLHCFTKLHPKKSVYVYLHVFAASGSEGTGEEDTVGKEKEENPGFLYRE